jgi:hypothetical protein
LKQIFAVVFPSSKRLGIILEADRSVAGKEGRAIFYDGHFTLSSYWPNEVPSYFPYCMEGVGIVKYLPILPVRKLFVGLFPTKLVQRL